LFDRELRLFYSDDPRMNSNLFGLIFGVFFAVAWGVGVKRGTMFGHEPIIGLPFSCRLWVRRDVNPTGFWLLSALWGAIAIAFLALPIVRWATGS
jgi:hypothetical protein